jgi:hypothetical protein
MQIFKSRKFWITVVDAVVSIATVGVTLAFAKDLETRAFVLGVITALQPVVISLINGIATEDAALTAANAVRDAAVTTVSAPAVPNPVEPSQA